MVTLLVSPGSITSSVHGAVVAHAVGEHTYAPLEC